MCKYICYYYIGTWNKTLQYVDCESMCYTVISYTGDLVYLYIYIYIYIYILYL